MTNETIIFSCPFCSAKGADAHVHQCSFSRYYVHCRVCNAQGPVHKSESDAVASWNLAGRLDISLEPPLNQVVVVRVSYVDIHGSKQIENLFNMIRDVICKYAGWPIQKRDM